MPGPPISASAPGPPSSVSFAGPAEQQVVPAEAAQHVRLVAGRAGRSESEHVAVEVDEVEIAAGVFAER